MSIECSTTYKKSASGNGASTKNIKTLITRAECEVKRAENQASMANALARKVKIQIFACTHKAKVEAETLEILSKKAKAEPEVQAKYQAAEAQAVDKKRKAISKKKEAIVEAKRFRGIASAKRIEAKAIKDAYEKDIANAEAQNAEAKALKIEAEVQEIEVEARKAASEAKKAKLEAEEAAAASASIVKHAKALALAEDEIKVKNAEFEIYEAEAKARNAQAAAKKAEAKAIKAGDMAKAEAQKLEARIHQAEAIAKHDEIKEVKAMRAKPKSALQQELRPPINQFPEKQARFIEKKHLSAQGLLTTVYETFQRIPDPNHSTQESESKITLSDCLMSGLALFGLKYPSLLQFDRDSKEGGCINHNLKTLYKVNRPPSDTYMRERLDNVDPSDLRPAFKKLFAQLQRGKELEKYMFLDGYYLASGDGTGLFTSKTISCGDCCVKCHKDGTNTYYHQMMSAVIVHPDHTTVIPLCPEPITNKDGSEKNDCERNASERLYRHIRREHPHLPLIITEDALGSNGPHIYLLKELDMRFILVVKPDGNKSLFEFIKGIQRQEHVYTEGELTYKIQFLNDIPLNDSHTDLKVNFFEVWVHNKNGDLQYHNSWVTDIFITASNAYRLCQGGRAKWKIENETFNTLKNQDYHFEHNFGHGFKNLCTVFALLMFLAFLIDQIQQSSCGLFQGALTKMGSKVRLWGRMRAYFMTLFIDSWEQFLQGIVFGIHEGRLIAKIQIQDTS